MRAKPSILKLEQFVLLEASFYVEPFGEDLPGSMSDYMNELPVDIDFDILMPPEDDEKEQRYIPVKVIVNPENQPGYVITAEGAGLFSFPKKKVNEQDKADLLLSGVNICITSMRNYISSLTVFSPFGAYTLPAIDMDDLHKRKQKAMLQEKKRQDAKD